MEAVAAAAALRSDEPLLFDILVLEALLQSSCSTADAATRNKHAPAAQG